jgi:predicted aspartyl protease
VAHQTYGPAGSSSADRSRELSINGPLLDISIEGVGSAFAGLNARGLIDTGASVVVRDQRIADKLGLRLVNEDTVGLVGGVRANAKIYMGYIKVPILGFQEIMPLYAVPMKYESHNVLLGRSFLRHFIVTFNGPSGMFHFATPHGDTQETPENLDG